MPVRTASITDFALAKPARQLPGGWTFWTISKHATHSSAIACLHRCLPGAISSLPSAASGIAGADCLPLGRPVSV